MRRSLPLLLLLAACTPTLAVDGMQGVVTERLYFGRKIGDSLGVSDSAWGAFLREVVTERFPEGFTHWSASGQWRGADGRIILEPSFVLEVHHSPASAPADSSITAIVREYKRRFRQEAVLRVVTPGRASF